MGVVSILKNAQLSALDNPCGTNRKGLEAGVTAKEAVNKGVD